MWQEPGQPGSSSPGTEHSAVWAAHGSPVPSSVSVVASGNVSVAGGNGPPVVLSSPIELVDEPEAPPLPPLAGSRFGGNAGRRWGPSVSTSPAVSLSVSPATWSGSRPHPKRKAAAAAQNACFGIVGVTMVTFVPFHPQTLQCAYESSTKTIVRADESARVEGEPMSQARVKARVRERLGFDASGSLANLRWTESRWHLDGRGIHAGDILEIRALKPPDNVGGMWFRVAIESQDAGRVLFAHFELDGLAPMQRVHNGHELRWTR